MSNILYFAPLFLSIVLFAPTSAEAAESPTDASANLSDLNDAWRQHGRALPHRGNDGDIDGYRISQLPEKSRSLGFENGDIVMRINGVPLDSVRAIDDIVESLRLTRGAIVELVRRGEPVTLMISLS